MPKPLSTHKDQTHPFPNSQAFGHKSIPLHIQNLLIHAPKQQVLWTKNTQVINKGSSFLSSVTNKQNQIPLPKKSVLTKKPFSQSMTRLWFCSHTVEIQEYFTKKDGKWFSKFGSTEAPMQPPKYTLRLQSLENSLPVALAQALMSATPSMIWREAHETIIHRWIKSKNKLFSKWY